VASGNSHVLYTFYIIKLKYLLYKLKIPSI